MAKETYLAAVKRHVDQVLEHAGDHYREPATPLVADFISLETNEPPEMKPEYGDAMVVSSVPCYVLDCLPDAAAAFLCYKTVTK